MMRSLRKFLTAEAIAKANGGPADQPQVASTWSRPLIVLPVTMLIACTGMTSMAAAKSKPVDEPIAPKAVPVPSVDAAPLLPVGATTTEGTPFAIDGDTLQIGDKTIRLYGIAVPDIHADHGADARLALDQLMARQRIQCSELDRGKDALVIASCRIGDRDIAEQLLLAGYAAVYRSQSNPTTQERDLAQRYDAAEAKARQQHLGLWAQPPQPPAEVIAPMPEPEPWIDRKVIRSWIVATPILLISLIAFALLSHSFGRQWRQQRRQMRLQATSLLAQILAEVLAIREAAAEQIGGLSGLQMDRPVPPTHVAFLSLPPSLIYAANAGQLYHLPRDIGVDLVQFYAAHAGIGQMLRQAAHLRADSLRQALVKIVEAADIVLERGQRQLD
jgi:endonuclease YncB( thermonuclease family)